MVAEVVRMWLRFSLMIMHFRPQLSCDYRCQNILLIIIEWLSISVLSESHLFCAIILLGCLKIIRSLNHRIEVFWSRYALECFIYCFYCMVVYLFANSKLLYLNGKCSWSDVTCSFCLLLGFILSWFDCWRVRTCVWV